MAFPDLVRLAQQRGWKAEDPLALAVIAQLVQAGKPVLVVQVAGTREWRMDVPGHLTVLEELPPNPDPSIPLVVITDRTGRPRPDVDRLAVLRPPTLALGVAGRRVLQADDLEEAFRQLCRREGYSPLSLSAVAASVRRRSWAMLDEFAERRQLPMLYYADAILRRSPLPIPGRMAGTCAVAAVLAAGATETVVASRAFFGRLTLALARRKSQGELSGSGPD